VLFRSHYEYDFTQCGAYQTTATAAETFQLSQTAWTPPRRRSTPLSTRGRRSPR
jgi:hypothetical protein